MPNIAERRKQVSEAISQLLFPLGYRYIKQKDMFVCERHDLVDSIIIDCNRYSTAFYFGRRFNEAARVEADLEQRKVSEYDRTIFHYSVNVGPAMPMRYKAWARWDADRSTESRVLQEMSEFLRDFVLPWLDKYPDMLSVRDALSEPSGEHLIVEPYKQIFAIDVSLNDRSHFDAYLGRILSRANKIVPANVPAYAHRLNEILNYCVAIVQHYPTFLPQVPDELQEAVAAYSSR